MGPSRSQWGPVRSLLTLAPLFIGAAWLAVQHQYSLPTPKTDLFDPQTSLPQISESVILYYAKYLSEDIGYRTPGTREHALGDAWMFQKASELKAECDRLASESGRKLECELWRQEGTGSHRFDMMNKRLYKHYVNLSNIIIRVSDGTSEGKEHAVLINAHVDSTLPSPGAADDGLAVGVMAECFRVLINTPEWSPTHAIIFLFNNAEESLQDGSHLYTTQHPTAPTVRAVLNLEAAGTTGPELLFQATSEQMIKAYSHVPRPFGTVFANEVFSSGIILSDTDFRQFEQYLNVTGLDMAVVGNSYLYHMRKDLVENIQPGVAQHMAENTLALLLYLSSSESPVKSLASGYARPSTVFFSHLGFFFSYSFQTAKILYSLLFISSLVLTAFISDSNSLSEGLAEQLKGILAVIAGALGAVIAPNLLAVIMQRVLGRSLSWFSNERYPILLYGPPALIGAIGSQIPFGRIPEKTMFTALLILQSFLATVVQFLGIGSAAMFFLSSFPLFIALTVNAFVAEAGEITLLTYALGQLVPILTGVQVTCATLDVFVPLTGRIGGEAPAEHIIATIVAAMGSFCAHLILPFAHRYSQRLLSRTLIGLILITGVTVSYFATKYPFDSMHQKRIFVLHMENLNTEEQHLHIAAADSAPGFNDLVVDISGQFGADGLVPLAIIMDDWNSDWDNFYPFSAFLSPFKIDLPLDPAYAAPWPPEEQFAVSAINNVIDEVAGTRSFTLKVDHAGIIWTVVAFDAHVLKWTLDENPPNEYDRHHIKEASFYGTDSWSIDLTVKLPNASSTDNGIKVNFVGIQESRMWPGKKAEKENGGRAMKLFEEFDDWLDVKTGGTVDATLLGCVTGEVVI